MPPSRPTISDYMGHASKATALANELTAKIEAFERQLSTGFNPTQRAVTRVEEATGRAGHLRLGKSGGQFQLQFAWTPKSSPPPAPSDYSSLLGMSLNARMFAVQMFSDLLAILVPDQEGEVERLDAAVEKVNKVLGDDERGGW